MERNILNSLSIIKERSKEIGLSTPNERIKSKVFEIIIEVEKIEDLLKRVKVGENHQLPPSFPNKGEILLQDKLSTLGQIQKQEQQKYMIRNMRNTTGKKCHCTSWICHYKKNLGKSPNEKLTCSISGCMKEAKVGAHVMFIENQEHGKKHFIIPMCKSHNSTINKPLCIKQNTKLVSAKNTECNAGSKTIASSSPSPKVV